MTRQCARAPRPGGGTSRTALPVSPVGERMLSALARTSALDVVAARSGPRSRERPSRRRERAWVRAAQEGSDEAMEALFREHWSPAHRAAYLIVHDSAAAEDIAQEAFLAAIRALDRFDRRRPFGPWLHRIVVNRAIDWARARALRREVWEPVESEAPAERPEGWSDEVVAALSVLDADQRAAVVLRHLLEYTPGEIADLLEVPRGTVNSRLRRALDRLAVELEPARADQVDKEARP
jgi:RNA polymerase sigma-70 factor (ECF subfamily)